MFLTTLVGKSYGKKWWLEHLCYLCPLDAYSTHELVLGKETSMNLFFARAFLRLWFFAGKTVGSGVSACTINHNVLTRNSFSPARRSSQINRVMNTGSAAKRGGGKRLQLQLERTWLSEDKWSIVANLLTSRIKLLALNAVKRFVKVYSDERSFWLPKHNYKDDHGVAMPKGKWKIRYVRIRATETTSSKRAIPENQALSCSTCANLSRVKKKLLELRTL